MKSDEQLARGALRKVWGNSIHIVGSRNAFIDEGLQTVLSAIREARQQPKTDLEKQEQVVQIIYDFARSQQDREHDCFSAPLGAKAFIPGTKPDVSQGNVSVNLSGVREALESIMETFGYEIIHIE